MFPLSTGVQRNKENALNSLPLLDFGFIFDEKLIWFSSPIHLEIVTVGISHNFLLLKESFYFDFSIWPFIEHVRPLQFLSQQVDLTISPSCSLLMSCIH